MKKILSLILAVAMIASLGIFSSVAEDDLVLDLSTLKTNVDAHPPLNGWEAAGWEEGGDIWLLQVMNFGEYINLGAIDLSKYESVTIAYGRDASHTTQDTAGFYLASGPVQNGDATPNEGVTVYADFSKVMNHEAGSGTWAAFGDEEGDLEVTLDLSNYKAGSEVYLSAMVLPCTDDCAADAAGKPGGIGFALTYIKFTAKSGDAPSTGDEPSTGGDQKPDDQKPDDQPGNTPTADTSALVCMVAAAAVIATVLLKKRAF